MQTDSPLTALPLVPVKAKVLSLLYFAFLSVCSFFYLVVKPSVNVSLLKLPYGFTPLP